MKWTKLAEADESDRGTPGQQFSTDEATVYANEAKTRFRIKLETGYGSNQGYLEYHGQDEREYRADSLDELMRISLAAEQRRDNPNQEIQDAIRAAIYAAEDAL